MMLLVSECLMTCRCHCTHACIAHGQTPYSVSHPCVLLVAMHALMLHTVNGYENTVM